MGELVDMIVKEYPPNVICAELGLCVDHEIASNAIPPVSFETIQVEAPLDNSVSCEMCEFAVTVIDERLDDEATIDQIEREVQFVCSYLPGSIGDKCEELVDMYGEKLIEALVKQEMDPKKVCSELLPSCAANKSAKQPCVWGPEMWCASPFHARMCGATAQCGFQNNLRSFIALQTVYFTVSSTQLTLYTTQSVHFELCGILMSFKRSSV